MRFAILCATLVAFPVAAGLSDDIRILQACDRAFAAQPQPYDEALRDYVIPGASAELAVKDRLAAYSESDQAYFRAQGVDSRAPDDPVYSDPRMIEYCKRELRRIAKSR